MTNLFDAAIADLDNSRYFNNFVATATGDKGVFRKKKYYHYNQAERDAALLKIPQIEAAIRVLEAAGNYASAKENDEREMFKRELLHAALPDRPEEEA
jgi:hypothetical protein